MYKVLQGTQRLATPKLCLQGAYNKRTLYDVSGGMSNKYETIITTG